MLLLLLFQRVSSSSSLVVLFLSLSLMSSCCFWLSSATVSSTELRSYPENPGFTKLVAWVKANGGRVDERFGLARLEHGVRGGVALADIEEGTELLYCPWELVIGSSSLDNQMKSSNDRDMCNVIHAMETEFRLKGNSFWNAYLELDDSMINSRLPTLWSQTALDELQNLIPDATRHLQWYQGTCNTNNNNGNGGGTLDEVTVQALFSFITRASGVGMVPIYDLLNHHNGKRNVKLELSEAGVQLVAVGPIEAGGEIFLSYGIKLASTMYRDYGFLEMWPQIWTFQGGNPSGNHAFAIFPDGVVAINPTEPFLRANWSAKPHLPLVQIQVNAIEHMQQQTVDALWQFQSAARDMLERLPTSLGEDALILEQMKKTRANRGDTTNTSEEEEEEANDIISAIQYRMTFKEAVLSAIDATEDMLRLKADENSEL